jgi:methylmalonyl-CoA/ethylmalonyl-CoA epimerase
MLSELGCTFHHLGVACRNLEGEAKVWTQLGYTADGPDFEDPIQMVKGRFLSGAGPRLELLIPTTPHSPVAAVLQRGEKIYHQAFIAPNLAETVDTLRRARCKLTVGPVPAVAFGGRQIAFLMTPTMNLLEFIEAKP